MARRKGAHILLAVIAARTGSLNDCPLLAAVRRRSGRTTYERNEMKQVYLALVALILPGVAAAQRSDDRAQFDARMNVLERSVAELSIQIERLRASDQEFKRKLDAMRTNYDERLDRLEKGGAPKTPTPRRSKP